MTGTETRVFAWLFCVFIVMSPLAGQAAQGADAQEKQAASNSSQDWRVKLSLPGPDHERLNALIGEWNTAIKFWRRPDDEAVELTGSVTCRWALGGRFIEEQAEDMPPQEGGFQSLGYLGYNRKTELYERFWMTNTSTGMFSERGRYDPDSNLIRTRGSEIDPDSGVVILTTSELKIESPSRHSLTAYATGADGVRWKQLEIIYSKK